MNMQDWVKLRQDMGETAALPPEDKRRRDVEARIVSAGVTAEVEWLALLQEDEQLRLDLMRVKVPTNLEARLLEIPDTIKMEPKPILYPRFWQIAAACLVMALGSWVFITSRSTDTPLPLMSLAAVALQHHQDDQHDPVPSIDAQTLAASLKGELPFGTDLPDLGAQYTLLGGRKCNLCKNPAIYSVWTTSRGTSGLFQFSPEDFRLPNDMKKKCCCLGHLAKKNDPCCVVIWTTNGRGYALVTHHEEAKGLHAQAQKVKFPKG